MGKQTGRSTHKYTKLFHVLNDTILVYKFVQNILLITTKPKDQNMEVLKPIPSAATKKSIVRDKRQNRR